MFPDVSEIPPVASTGTILLLGCLVVYFAYRRKGQDNTRLPSPPSSEAPHPLAKHPELVVAHNSFTHSLVEMTRQSDEILRDATMLRLAEIKEEVRRLAAGRVVFTDTESWRVSYENLLRSEGLSRYLSIAWLRSEDYWRDAPGRHSMQLNYDMIQLGLRIERTLILNDFFWPPAARLPAASICRWIEEQHKRGIAIRLLRESAIEEEKELLWDIGIYGTRATGTLELDDQCCTVRFTLDFNREAVRLAQQRWERLLLFAKTYREVLDQAAQAG